MTFNPTDSSATCVKSAAADPGFLTAEGIDVQVIRKPYILDLMQPQNPRGCKYPRSRR